MVVGLFYRQIKRVALSCGLLAGLSICPAALADNCQWISWNPEASGSSASHDSQSSKPAYVYDIAPAMARTAVAEVSYDQAYAGLRDAVATARRQFENSSEYISAQHELDDAIAGYESACEPVRADLLDNPDYHSLIENRTEMEIAMSTPGISSTEKIALATKKMEYASAAAKLEALAIANDRAARDAKLRLDAARQTMLEKTLRFETTLYEQPMVAAAMKNFQAAKINRAGSEAYLQGAWITRADTIDADTRRNPGADPIQYAAPAAVYWGNPYWWGYYGINVVRY